MVPDPPHYFHIGGLTFQVEADLPITARTFDQKFERFRVPTPGPDTVTIRHHFSLPDLAAYGLGRPVYNHPPWAVYRCGDGWVYLGILPYEGDAHLHRVGVFNADHSQADIYHLNPADFCSGDLNALSLIPADQILLARLLALRGGCLLHASGLVLDGRGLAFVGHSEAGKTTISRLLMGDGQLLCDDRVILRRWPEGFRVHGTWSHGDIPQVSPASAPLRAVFLLEQAPENRLVRLEPPQAVQILPLYVVRPFVTRDWWESTLDLLGELVRSVPVYRLRFDKSGGVRCLLHDLLDGNTHKLDGYLETTT